MVKSRAKQPVALASTMQMTGYLTLAATCLTMAVFSLLTVAYLLGGYWSLVAAFLAIFVCGFAVIAHRLLFSLVFGDRIAAAYCSLGGMLLRMALPLSVCLILEMNRSPLLDAGFAQYLIAAYLIVLSVDVTQTVFKLKKIELIA